MRLLAIAAPVIAFGCAKQHGEGLRMHVLSFCHTLQSSVALARDEVAAGHDSVVPYGEIRAQVLGIWFNELALCQGIRAPRDQANALFTRFQKVVDDADQLMTGGVLPAADSPSRAKVQSALGQLASIVESVNALPLRDD